MISGFNFICWIFFCFMAGAGSYAISQNNKLIFIGLTTIIGGYMGFIIGPVL